MNVRRFALVAALIGAPSVAYADCGMGTPIQVAVAACDGKLITVFLSDNVHPNVSGTVLDPRTNR